MSPEDFPKLPREYRVAYRKFVFFAGNVGKVARKRDPAIDIFLVSPKLSTHRVSRVVSVAVACNFKRNYETPGQRVSG